MVSKFLSLAMLICCCALYTLDVKDPHDPIFYIVSGGLALEILRIVLASMVAILVFVKLPNKLFVRLFFGLLGMALLLGGITSFYINYFESFGTFKPVDLLMITEVGIIISLLAVEPRQVKLPAQSQPQRQTALKTINVPLS